ncbi:MAG TPA: BamA/TamA family outer membrane protein [Nevskiaceae bacterium]|nr:BamA/TamA family outer membrane protein [Nevskiaceae bacterium]
MALSPVARAGIAVHIHGLGSDERDNVEAQLSLLTYAKGLKGKPPEAAEVQPLLAQADADIRRALQPFGWYTPTIHNQVQHHGDNWVADYTVDAGPETDVIGIDIDLTGPGAKLPALVAAARRRWPLKLGTRIKAQDYATVKDRLLGAAQAQGYLRARYTRHELKIDPAKRSAQVLLTLDTGPRFYFGPITVEQSRARLKPAVIQRYLTIHEGQPFKPSELLATQFALSDLGYFQDVELQPQRDAATPGHHIPVVVKLSYAKPFLYRFGVGYGTDTGARALAGVQWRRVNSRGHTVSVDLQPSQKISAAVARYDIPFGSVPGQKYELTAQGLKQNFQGINERLYSLGGARIHLQGVWKRRWYLSYVNDTYAIGGEPQRHSTLLMPGVSFSRTDIDNPIYPRHGWALSVDVHGAPQAGALSSTNFLSTRVKLNAVFPIDWRWRVLLRGEEGAIFSTHFDRLPPSQRFFAGGNGSVRGYSYRSLAPRNQYGRVVGGKYLTTGSLELDWDIHRPYGVAAFVDAGGADDVPDVRLHVGAGLGFRYLAPFGTLALDVAHPFDRHSPAVRFDIAMRVGL